MTYAICIHEHGGPEVLRWEEVAVGDPGPGEVRLKQRAVGLNYIDVYHRSGLYPVAKLPAVIGMEGVGEVTAVGPDVTEFQPGDRVAYASPMGSYAEERLIAADRVVRLPDAIDDRTAAAMMLQGMTAQYLLRQTFRVESGQTVLIHAAAGGVGTIATQWARHLGATVIGTVGSPEKAAIAAANGCHHVIDYTVEDFVARVREITGGAGVPVVYDGVGRSTFDGSLDCLKPRGLMVAFGNASGAVPPFDILRLAQKGSLYLTRPTTSHYIGSRAGLEAASSDLFEVVRSGAVRIAIGQSYPLAEAATAHRDLEARRTTGASILLP